MNKFRIPVSLFVIAGAGFFVWRHQTLRHVKSEQDRLQQQIEQATNAPVRSAPPVSIAVSTNTGLSAAERSELLRLRGQVAPLRQELAQATNELASIARAPRAASPGVPEEPYVTRGEIVQKMNRGKQWILALILYAQEHQERFPGALNEATSFAPGVEGADQFEFVQPGLDISSVKAASTTIVLREKQSWKSANGRWNRTYAFADGHVENAVSDTNDFTEWEARRQAAGNQAAGQ